jgi:hypothetical protein
MSITVVIARDDVGAPSTREVYETGVKFTTESGDLSILSDRPQLLARYGSGNWLSVHVDDNVTVISEKPADSGGEDFDFGGFDDDSSSSDDTPSDDAPSDDAPSDDAPSDDAPSDDASTDTSDAPSEDEPAAVS